MTDQFDALSFLQATMRSLPESNQLEYVLARFSRVANCSLVVFDAQGDVLASLGDVPANLFWEFATDTAPDAQGQVGRWSLRVRRSGPSGGIFTLVFGSRESKDIHVLDDIVDALTADHQSRLLAEFGTDG